MAEGAGRRRVRRRRLWRRGGLPRSRSALALGAVVAVALLVLLLLGLTRARPGQDVPAYQPGFTTTTSVPLEPRPLPEVTAPATIAAAPATPKPTKAATTTTTGRR